MVFVTFVLLIVVPSMAVSIALALLPIRHRGALTCVMAAHVIASAGLIWWLPERDIWRIALGPGLVLAAIRLTRVLVTGRTKL